MRIEALLERAGDRGMEPLSSPRPDGLALLDRCSLEDQRAANCLALATQRSELRVRSLAEDERAACADMRERAAVKGIGLATGRQRRARDAVGANGQVIVNLNTVLGSLGDQSKQFDKAVITATTADRTKAHRATFFVLGFEGEFYFVNGTGVVFEAADDGGIDDNLISPVARCRNKFAYRI